MAGRDVGKMGEREFGKWCDSAGLVANESNVDKTGWDFVVEFPLGRESQIHDPALEARLQVKSSDDQKRKVQIKLSHLQRMANAPYPTFVVALEFDGKESPKSAFLIHFDHEWVTKILHR